MNELLCGHCPLQRAESTIVTQIQLQERAVELQYRDNIFVQPNDISGILVKEYDAVDQETADFAVGCLHKVMRNNCPTYAIGTTPSGTGLIPRN